MFGKLIEHRLPLLARAGLENRTAFVLPALAVAIAGVLLGAEHYHPPVHPHA